MIIELLTFSKDFNFTTKESFPRKYKDELENAIKAIKYEHKKRRQFDHQIDDQISSLGYFSEVKNKKECQLWPDLLYYNCQFHASMKGEIKIVSESQMSLLKLINQYK